MTSDKQIDPRLLAQLENAADSDELEALVMVEGGAPASNLEATEREVVETAAAKTHQEPSFVRYLTNLGIVHVRGRSGLLRRILDDDRVVSASASADDFYLPDPGREVSSDEE